MYALRDTGTGKYLEDIDFTGYGSIMFCRADKEDASRGIGPMVFDTEEEAKRFADSIHGTDGYLYAYFPLEPVFHGAHVDIAF